MLLDEALDLILSHAKVSGRQELPLADCFGRVCCRDNNANHPLPGYDQSARDGYAVCGPGSSSDGKHQTFPIKGEIQAGLCHEITIGSGEAYQIMTGGLLPIGTERVIAQEDCQIAGAELIVGNTMLCSSALNIRTRGGEYQLGAQLVDAGTRLNESHLALLAAAGNHLIEVFERPRVAFFCSGSELVMADEQVKNGQKYSSNHLLLESLVKKFGGQAKGFGVVADERVAIGELLQTIKDSNADIVISTGGVGPGKFDLFGELLPDCGAQILYQSLHIRPGRSTLFGLLDDKLYFGLPGPPTAVRVLFLELLCPLLRKMQGMRFFHNQRLQAALDHPISLKSSRAICFKEGVYRHDGGRVVVGYPCERQTPNCSIMIMPGRVSYDKGDQVLVSIAQTD
ncbi:MAG: molybdopterin molybdotransferase MoeA [Desulfofustis sp.]|nr:molybdopterin molybdotransferase MoeA [Desulfofustis sp.]